MQHQQLNWSEGQFLRPHHFQSADRYWHELLDLASNFNLGYPYGVFSAVLNEDALDNQILQLVRFRGRTKRGTIISFDDSAVDRIDLNAKLESDAKFVNFLRDHDGVKVYLCVPHLKLSKPNVSLGGDANQHRYLGNMRELEDEAAGGNPQPVETRTLNCRLMFESDDLDGFEAIPLFRLIRSRELDGKLKKDPHYFPPCLTVRSHPELQRNMMESAYDLLNTRAEVLRRQIIDSGITFSTQVAGAVDRLMLLRTINEALGGLNCYAFADGIHPLEAYQMLCQLIGRLSIFGADKSLGGMPRYDHDDLHTIFQWALDRIRALIDIGDEGYFQRFFKGVGRAKLRVNIEPEWFSRNWQLVLGIHSLDLSAGDCLTLLDRKVAWKLAQPSFVDYCYEKQARGLKLRKLKNIPSVLPKSPGWLFFSFADDEQWDEVKTEGAIGLRLNSDQVKNLADLENNQLIQLQAEASPFRVELAVFAIREKK
jgi:type VI secretion system protein ImpJ